ncbi:NACHT domain-containing protein [Streptomyces sp. NBC_00868]|uniref:NACHT domain-containing protein n=1 Tax=unclassified Streptomyces TaxID=2593676 RepID=UPI0032498ADE|nr:NACHT domain-containing protein [Streptomyces sp. NBC_00868]
MAGRRRRARPRGGPRPVRPPPAHPHRHGERLPSPREFLAATPLDGAAPDGWAARVLRGGRALLLVDGFDEIPAAERDRARDWLADLITAYPGNRWLVTSRPSAVRQDWLGAEGFDEVLLTPMTPDHVRAFVTRWHAAAAPVDPALEGRLLESVRTKPDLARLATNPLLCGLICALHRERRGFLPSGRKELYTAALSMLLHRRDRERGLRLPDLAEEPQLQLLQRLAYWLIRNGRTELDRDRAEALIADALPAVPAVRVLGEAPAVFHPALPGALRAAAGAHGGHRRATAPSRTSWAPGRPWTRAASASWPPTRTTTSGRTSSAWRWPRAAPATAPGSSGSCWPAARTGRSCSPWPPWSTRTSWTPYCARRWSGRRAG